MSYLVLARKYRPQTFEDVIAQKHITDTLQNAIKQKRFSHAYLFTGTRGTGKTTTARILAKALNCEHGPLPVPCNECSNCKQITNGSSLDVIEVDAASNTGIDDIRDLREKARYTPATSRYKIYIIDEIHRLSGNAFDGLLKTLEEPPSHVIFIFATTDPQKLPPTILSRCQRYDFRRIPFKDMSDYLKMLADKEKIDIEEEGIALLAQKGDGSLRDALSIFEQVMACSDQTITRELIADTLGLVDLELLFKLTDCILNKDSNGALKLVEEMFVSGVDVSQFISDFQEHFRKILIVNASENPFDYLAISDYFQEKYIALKNKFSDSDIFRIVKMLSDLQLDLKAGADPSIFLEIAILRMVRMESSVLLEDVLKKLNELNLSGGAGSDLFSSNISTSSKKKSNPVSPIAPSNLSVASATVQSQVSNTATATPAQPRPQAATPLSWSELVERIKDEKRILGEFLGQGELTRMDGESVELTYFGNGTAQQQHIARRENRMIIEKNMRLVFGKALRLITKVDKSQPPRTGTEENDSPFDITPEKLFEQNPEFKKAVDLFGGEVKSIKIIGNKGEKDG
ncbi:MAG TPA: DNA polymerase III subunit gamma/tau [candidate division Zixibacteria bacterium]|nr:DNA polymerase III subunit gamma/tau [candidate division Zixibacteria bacterium]